MDSRQKVTVLNKNKQPATQLKRFGRKSFQDSGESARKCVHHAISRGKFFGARAQLSSKIYFYMSISINGISCFFARCQLLRHTLFFSPKNDIMRFLEGETKICRIWKYRNCKSESTKIQGKMTSAPSGKWILKSWIWQKWEYLFQNSRYWWFFSKYFPNFGENIGITHN